MAGRWYTEPVIIATHDPTMTNQFMNDLTESIQVPSTTQPAHSVLAAKTASVTIIHRLALFLRVDIMAKGHHPHHQSGNLHLVWAAFLS